MPDLITPSRAAQSPALAQLAADNPAYLASLISAASEAVRRATGRDFAAGAYSEYHSGGVYVREPLRLRQFPVLEITRVACDPRPALSVTNTSPANQRATVETTATGLRLTRVASAVVTTNDLAYASYPTVALMASAINALSAGWSASSVSGFDNWPAADLKPLQGAFAVTNGFAQLEIYADLIQPLGPAGFRDDSDAGPTGWRLDDEAGQLFARFPRGQLNIRIDYRAGFVMVPQPIQEACVQLVQDLYQAGLVNSSLKKATLGPSTIETKDQSAGSSVSAKVRMLLAPYIDYSKVIFR